MHAQHCIHSLHSLSSCVCRGVCKRKLDAFQMKMQKAFASCLAAFEKISKDSGWQRLESQRPASLSPLGLFIERREAVWIERSALATVRENLPRLAVLKGVHSTYGFSWTPGAPDVAMSRFLCHCAECVDPDSRRVCRYAAMTRATNRRFRVLPPRSDIKLITVPRLKAFLAIKAPHLPKSGLKPALMQIS